MKITRELFEQQRQPRFGNSNPERIRNEFWEWMIRGGEGERSGAGENAADSVGPHERRPNSPFSAYHARSYFNLAADRCDGPIWTFDRMGASRTELPDGRIICIGGEHEDFYDQDFCIYNDVVVFRNEEIEIYGYPKALFQPTDFHTATLLGNRIILIGCIGYQGERRHGRTPVYALDLDGYRISETETWGEAPGWISKHEASVDRNGEIVVRGGSIFVEQGGVQRFRRNLEEFAFNPSARVWKRLTSRNWRLVQIRQEDHSLFVLENRPDPKSLVPKGVRCTVVPCAEWDQCRIEVDGVPVCLIVGLRCIEIVVQGELPESVSARIAEEVKAIVEASIRRKCVLELL